MKKSYKLISVCALLLLFSQVSYSFDYGFELSNAGGIKKIDELTFNTDHKETVWISLPLNEENTSKIAMEGSIYASLTDKFRYFATLDLLRFSATPVDSTGLKLSIDAGRIPVSDSTGFVINHVIDGTEFHFSFPFGNIDFSTGYTGLLNARSSSILMSIDDSQDAQTEKIYDLGSKRLIGKVVVQIPQAFGNVDFIAEGIGQYDMRRHLGNDWQELIDTAYGTMALSGPVLNNLYYSLSGTYQTGVQELSNKTKSSENSFLASARLDLFPSKGNQLFAQFVYTPSKNDFFSNYIPISTVSPGTLFPSGFTNLMRASAGWYFNPISNFNFDFGGNVFLNSGDNGTSSEIYNSSEISGGATFKATSDLRFRLDSSIFLPNSENLQYQASLRAIFEL
ncbi:MAG TPA: hypothetical protein VJ861_05405, partial [Treponemataceae bacterium]|nr:hypothetical protein [Treponemataceae bacterium]